METIKDLEARRQALFTKEYKEILRQRDEASLAYEATKEEKRKLGTKYAKLPAVAKRDWANQARQQYISKRNLMAKLTPVKAEAAKLAKQISDLKDARDKKNGNWKEYDAAQLGYLKNVGFFEIGSPQWHDTRLRGIGGSDMGKLLQTGVIHKLLDSETLNERIPVSEYASKADWDHMAQLKAGYITEDHEDDDRNDLSLPTVQGDYTEEYIRHLFAENHPEVDTVVCKYSWRESDVLHANCNLDGLIADKQTGEIIGALEIKTGTTVAPCQWGEPGNIKNAPIAYQIQLIWYAMSAMLRKGTIAALLDGYKYVEYSFDMANDDDCEYVEWMISILKTTASHFWNDVEAWKDKIGKTEDAGAPSTGSLPKTMPKKNAVNMIQALMDLGSPSEVSEFVGSLYNGKSDATSTYLALKQIAQERNKMLPNPAGRKHKLIGIDLETTSLASSTGASIIETAVVTFDQEGNLITLADQLSGLTEEEMVATGTGMEEVHHITPEMLKGLTPFEQDTKLHKQILDALKGNVLVAHNANFEIQHLTTLLPGFAEMLDNKEFIVLDTRLIAKWFTHAENASLGAFVRYHDMNYEGAHRAKADTEMMLRAFAKWNSAQ